MKSIEVTSIVPIYEIDGSETVPHGNRKDRELTVRNHWNRREFVILELPGQKPITIHADDLCKAIVNAQNAHRF